jgi:hypothetical protein
MDTDASLEAVIEKAVAFAAQGDETEAAESAPSKQSTKPAEEAPSDDKPEDEGNRHKDHERAEQLLEELRSLGYKAEKGDVKRVTSGERKAFQKKLAKFNEEYNSGVADLEARAQTLAERYSRYSKAEQALHSGDMDAVAQSLGFQDWATLNVAQIRKNTSPEYQELQAIKQKLAEKERLEAEREAQAEADREAREQSEAETEYREELEGALLQTDDFSEWADDPDFLDAIISIQRKHYHDGETVDALDAAALALDGAWKMYEKLHAKFGRAKPGLPGGATATKPTSRASAGRKTIAQTDAVGASGVRKTSNMSEDEWFEYHARQLAASAD